MTLAGRMLLVKSETENIKSLLDSYHTDVAKKGITPKEISKMMPTMTSIVYRYINVMESKTGPPGILFLIF
jgi:hypothetical protein